MFRSIRGVGWLGLVVAVCLVGCGEAERPGVNGREAGAGIPVIAQQVMLEPEQVRLEAVGTSRAIRSVELHPAVPGEVTAIRFSAGQRVAAGDVLVQLDDREARLARDLARVRLEEAQRLLRRYQASQHSGAVTVSDLDNARSAAEAARIEFERAEVVFDDHRIEAPFDGVVGVSDLDPGARVTPDTTITTLDDRSQLLVRFDVPENLVPHLALGDAVTLAPWTGRSEPASGRIVDIDSRIDPVSRTVPVRAALPNPEDGLRPGMSFRVELVLDGPAYPVVPEVAVMWGGEGAYVWKLEDDRATRVPVTIVQRREGRVLVQAALAEGDRVVREGVQRMREGSLVRLAEPTP